MPKLSQVVTILAHKVRIYTKKLFFSVAASSFNRLLYSLFVNLTDPAHNTIKRPPCAVKESQGDLFTNRIHTISCNLLYQENLLSCFPMNKKANHSTNDQAKEEHQRKRTPKGNSAALSRVWHIRHIRMIS